MVNLSFTVFTWHQQNKTPKLFKDAIEKHRNISINEIINLNGGIEFKYIPTVNTVSLLTLVRKRGALTKGYLMSVSKAHSVVAKRILRQWLKSEMRGKLRCGE